MYHTAVEAGIDPIRYWDMTYEEILVTINVYSKNKINEQKQRASMDYILANLIGTKIGTLFDNKAKFPTIFEAYKGLFIEEEKQYIKEQNKPKQQDWKLIKDRISMYAKKVGEHQ